MFNLFFLPPRNFLSLLLCVYYLSFSIDKILIGKDAAVGEHKVLLGLIGAAVGVVTCVLYYSSYKEFDEIKK